MIWYATLAQARDEIKVEDSEVSTSNDDQVKEILRHVTGRIEQVKANEFAPRIKTVYEDAIPLDSNGPISGTDLWLSRDLLEATTVTNGDGTVIASSDYLLLPRGETPYRRIRLKSSFAWTYSDDPVAAIAILGKWGFRRRYDEAWLSSADSVQNNPLTAGATSITVLDADGADGWGRIPRFSPGQLLRIESEYVFVSNVNVTTNVLTVLRGQRGSTAAAHNQTTPIELWTPEPGVERAALRWAAYLYRRRGQFNTTTYDGATGVAVRFPPDVPEEVANILSEIPDWRDARVLRV